MPGIRRWMGQALDFTGRPLSARLHYGAPAQNGAAWMQKRSRSSLGMDDYTAVLLVRVKVRLGPAWHQPL